MQGRWRERTAVAGPRSPGPTSGQGPATAGRTRAERVTKYNEFHDGVRCHTYNFRRAACTDHGQGPASRNGSRAAAGANSPLILIAYEHSGPCREKQEISPCGLFQLLQGDCARFLAPSTWCVCTTSITDAETGLCSRALTGACVQQTAVWSLAFPTGRRGAQTRAQSSSEKRRHGAHTCLQQT